MGTLINLILLALGITSALAAFGGDTWRREPIPWINRVTKRGWIALTCMIATFFVGIVKEVRTNRSSIESSKRQENLQEQLVRSSENLEKTKNALEETRKKLASVEPSILEGIILATSGIRREADFSTPELRGQRSLAVISGRNNPDPLMLYGGDYLEYHVFVQSSPNSRQSGTLWRNRNAVGGLSVKVGDTQYPLTLEGRHMIIGPIGVPMPVTLLNPSGLNCSVKILIESADRTRVARQLSPLVDAIKTARTQQSLSTDGISP